jgi:transposase
MRTKTGNLHLEIQTSRKSPVGIIRTSFRKDGKIQHEQHGRIAGCTLEQLKMLQLAFKELVIPHDAPEAFQIIESKEYGASHALVRIIKETGLDKIIYSREEQWVKDVLVMIIGRIIFAGSKLSLCNHFDTSSLWEQFGVTERPDVEKHCYEPLDELLASQKRIQIKLAQKHLSKSHLVLYDITSSYLEGEYKDSELVEFGYNRDGKKGHEQIVIGLVCSAEGCPIGIEVYEGNTKDSTTVIDKINEIKDDYKVDKIVFVGDRGMITKCNRDQLKDNTDLHTITALTHPEILQLLNRKVVQLNFFDEHGIKEVVDPEAPSRRYMLCRNPDSAQRETKTRERLLELTKEGIEEIVAYKKATTVEILGARIGKVLEKYKMGKFVQWQIEKDKELEISRTHVITWSFDQEKINEEQSLDGCYIITTDVDKETMNENEVVASYKKLTLVEQAFRNLKTAKIEVRPIFHKKDHRIKAHTFLCMLSYYVLWHVQRRLTPLFENDGIGADRRWTVENAIECIAMITRNKVSVNGVTFYQISKVTDDQKKIYDLLGVN